MKLYLITIGSFRNMIIQSEMNPKQICDYVMDLGWKHCTVSVVEPGTIEDIPMHPKLKKLMES